MTFTEIIFIAGGITAIAVAIINIRRGFVWFINFLIKNIEVDKLEDGAIKRALLSDRHQTEQLNTIITMLEPMKVKIESLDDAVFRIRFLQLLEHHPEQNIYIEKMNDERLKRKINSECQKAYEAVEKQWKI